MLVVLVVPAEELAKAPECSFAPQFKIPVSTKLPSIRQPTAATALSL